MSKTILAHTNGWMPILEEMVDDYGLIAAAVWGVVWRYCQMKDGVCKASQETLSEKIGLSRKTINIHMSTLVKDGYFTAKVIPGIGIEYTDTGKAGMRMNFDGYVTRPTCEANSQVNNQPVTQSYNTCNAELQEGVTQSYTRKTLLKDSLKEEEDKNQNQIATTPTTFYDDLFFNVTGFMIPGSAREKVMDALNGLQLQGKANVKYLMPFLKVWSERGYKKTNCAWLFDWAITGEIPEKTNGKNGGDREAARQQMMREEAETRRYIEEVRIGTAI